MHAVPGPGLMLGLMLLAALVGGHSAKLVRIPKVIGFLAGGFFLRLLLGALFVADEPSADKPHVLDEAVAPLRTVTNLALGLILFTIGSAFDRARMRSGASVVPRMSVCEITGTVLLVLAGCLVAVMFDNGLGNITDRFVFCALLSCAAIATAPAATLLVLQEYEAKGPTTDTILGLVGVNNVVCIVVFHALFLAMAAAGALSTTGTLAAHMSLALAATLPGSVLLGMLCAVLISMAHAKLPVSESLLVFFATMILLGSGEHWLIDQFGLSYNFLLTAIVTGGLFANIAIDPEKLSASLRNIGAPVFAAFFVLAGYRLHVGDLAHMGGVGLAYVLCRTAGKVVGCSLGAKWAGQPMNIGARIGGALQCQAAVVIGLAAFVEHSWDHELARRFAVVILGSVVAFEICGPLLVKRCAVQSGEVKAITLLRRDAVPLEGGSVVQATMRSLMRLFGAGQAAAKRGQRVMAVEHIMRTSVQSIAAGAGFDEALHIIERSTYSHFPVIDESRRVIGVIHFSDVRDVIYEPAMRELVTAVDLADTRSAVVTPQMPLDALLDVFSAQNVSALPVVDSEDRRHLVGMVDQRDLLRAIRNV